MRGVVTVILIGYTSANTYYKCSALTKTCWPLESPMLRFRRAIWDKGNDEEHVCKMKCVCDPEVASSIQQGSAVEQKQKSEQNVSVPQAFGIGSVVLVIGLLVALVLCFYTIRSKLACCMKCRDCLKFESPFDAWQAADADEKRQNGGELTSAETRALSKSDKLHGDAEKRIKKKKSKRGGVTLEDAFEKPRDDRDDIDDDDDDDDDDQVRRPLATKRRSRSRGPSRAHSMRSVMSNETLLYA